MTKKRLNESSAPLAKLPGNIERAHFAAPGQKIRQCGRCKRDTVNYYYCPPCHVALNTSGDGELEEMTCHHG